MKDETTELQNNDVMPQCHMSGKSNHSLDSKNRVIIPAKLRKILGSEFKIYRPRIGQNSQKCLYCYNLEYFYFLEKEINSSRNDALKRSFYEYTDDAVFDKQGRVTLSKDATEYAGFEKQIVVVGTGNRVELWAPEERAKVRAQDDITMSLTDTSMLDF